MKQIIINSLHPGNYDKKLNVAFLLLRITVGSLMLTHGLGKFSSLFGSEPIQFADPIGLGAPVSLALAVFSEVLCSILIISGLFTRFAAFSLFFTMSVAALIHHADDPFGKQELPILYASIYFVIIIAGAGKLSIDNWIFSKNN